MIRKFFIYIIFFAISLQYCFSVVLKFDKQNFEKLQRFLEKEDVKELQTAINDLRKDFKSNLFLNDLSAAERDLANINNAKLIIKYIKAVKGLSDARIVEFESIDSFQGSISYLSTLSWKNLMCLGDVKIPLEVNKLNVIENFYDYSFFSQINIWLTRQSKDIFSRMNQCSIYGLFQAEIPSGFCFFDVVEWYPKKTFNDYLKWLEIVSERLKPYDVSPDKNPEAFGLQRRVRENSITLPVTTILVSGGFFLHRLKMQVKAKEEMRRKKIAQRIIGIDESDDKNKKPPMEEYFFRESKRPASPAPKKHNYWSLSR